MCGKQSLSVGAAVVLLTVAGAQAALLNLSWSATDPSARTIDLAPGESVNLYVWVTNLVQDLNGTDSVSMVSYAYNDAPVNSLDTGVSQPGWSDLNDPVNRSLGGESFRAAANQPLPGPGSTSLFATDASEWLIGYQTVELDSTITLPGDFNAMIPITIDFDYLVGTNVELLNANGAPYLYHPAYASSATGMGTYSGYYAFGTGSQFIPWVKKTPGQDENPLWIRVVPEPGMLFALALGGLALARPRANR